MELLLSISSGRLQVQKANGLQRNVVGNLTHYAGEETTNHHQMPSELAKRNRGVVLSETDTHIRIFTDPFRSVPLFVTRNRSGRIYLFSSFSELFSVPDLTLSVDPTGFWECVLYECPLWTRTVFSEVKQVPAASAVAIDKQTGECEIRRYWDFNIPRDTSIKRAEEAAEGLHEHLKRIFAKIDANQTFMIGLSGGLDSRITAAYLTMYLPPQHIRPFTYGYDPRILEHVAAVEVANILSLPPPRFHKLDANSYTDALGTMAVQSGCHVGIQHSHMYDVISRNRDTLAGSAHLSSMYTDALFGYHAVANGKQREDDETSYLRILRLAMLDSDIKDNIRNDVNQIQAGFDPSAGFTRLEEYLYLTERNPKFHVYMIHQLRRLLPVEAPFLDHDLLHYMIALPGVFRHQKRILDNLLIRYFPRLSIQRTPSISSRFQSGGEIQSTRQYLHYKALGWLNSILVAATGGQSMVFNKFATETQGSILRLFFREKLDKALETCAGLGLMNEKQRSHYSHIPLRSFGLASRYQIINLGHLLERCLAGQAELQCGLKPQSNAFVETACKT